MNVNVLLSKRWRLKKVWTKHVQLSKWPMKSRYMAQYSLIITPEKTFSKCVYRSLIARFIGPTWGPSGADRTLVGPMLAPWTHICGKLTIIGLNWSWLITWTASSYFLNQCWNVVHWTLGYKFQWNFNQNSNILLLILLKMSSWKWRSFCLGLNVLK